MSANATVAKTIDLLGAYAKILTLDSAVARALVRETLGRETFARVEPGWLTSRATALGCMRAIFRDYYHGRELGRGERPDLLAGDDEHAMLEGALGQALAALDLDDREILFLRFGAKLEPGELGRLLGHDEAAVGRRIEALCAHRPYHRSFQALSDRKTGARLHRPAAAPAHVHAS